MKTVLILLILIGAIAWVALRRSGGTGAPASALPVFAPDPDNETEITVRGWERNELERIIADFRSTYENDGYPSYSVAITPDSDPSRYRLSFPQDIHPTLFAFLINFLHYPFQPDSSNRTIQVVGWSRVTPGFEGVDAELVGRRAMFYVPANDRAHDTVHLEVESGETFANSFSELRWREATETRRPAHVSEMR